MGVQTCALPIYLAAIVGIDSPLIQFLLARRSDRANHRIIDLGTGEKPGPTRDAVKQAGIDLGQQARPQPVAPIAPPLPTGRIATATGYLGETRTAIRSAERRAGKAWSSTGRSGWSTDHEKKNNIEKIIKCKR